MFKQMKKEERTRKDHLEGQKSDEDSNEDGDDSGSDSDPQEDELRVSV